MLLFYEWVAAVKQRAYAKVCFALRSTDFVYCDFAKVILCSLPIRLGFFGRRRPVLFRAWSVEQNLYQLLITRTASGPFSLACRVPHCHREKALREVGGNNTVRDSANAFVLLDMEEFNRHRWLGECFAV